MKATARPLTNFAEAPSLVPGIFISPALKKKTRPQSRNGVLYLKFCDQMCGNCSENDMTETV